MHDYANLRISVLAGLPAIRSLLAHIGEDPIGPVLRTKVAMARRAYEDISAEMRVLAEPVTRTASSPKVTDGKPRVAPREWW